MSALKNVIKTIQKDDISSRVHLMKNHFDFVSRFATQNGLSVEEALTYILFLILSDNDLLDDIFKS